jgi:hypothetical protein
VPTTIDETPNTSNAWVARSKNTSKFTAESHVFLVRPVQRLYYRRGQNGWR